MSCKSRIARINAFRGLLGRWATYCLFGTAEDLIFHSVPTTNQKVAKRQFFVFLTRDLDSLLPTQQMSS